MATSISRLFSGKPIKRPPGNPPPAPQPPVNSAPATEDTNINTGVQFSADNGNKITISDVDSPVVICVIEADHGYIEVVPTPGVVIKKNKTAKVSMTGAPANINNALNGMWFVPYLDFAGTATIAIHTSDGISIDTDFVVVTVAGVAPPPPAPGPAPQNSVPGPQTVQSGATLAFSGPNAFSVADSDSTFLTTTLTVTGGRVQVPTSGGATILGNNSSQVSIQGTIAQINSALAGMTFVSNTGFAGVATIKIVTSDGVSTDTDTVSITVSSGNVNPNPGPTSPPFYPFGSRLDLANGRYPFGITVSNRPTATMDADLKNKYQQWKAARVYNVPAVPGAKAVKFSNANYPNTTNALTVSEGMGYGMMLAALFEDQVTFDGLLTLVRARPAYATSGPSRPDLYLMDWKLGPNGESSGNYGGGFGATDGDLDIAQGLLMADRQWGSNGAWNYKLEAQRTIAAIKDWYFNDGTLPQPFGSAGSDVSRTSDYMFGHFRSFASVTGDNFWTNTAIPRMIAINEKCQTVFSAANAGPGCFVPDAIVNADGSLAGKPIGSLRNGSLPGNVTNFAAAFGLTGQTTYGAGTDNYTPSPGGRLDFTPTEMHYFANAQRCPWRWGTDYIFSGQTELKTQSNRLINYVKSQWGNPSSTPIGMRLNAGLQGPQGGPISMGNAWPARGHVAGFMVGAMVDSAHQTYLNACYDYCMANWTTDYYDCELLLLAMSVASGNWFTYPGINVVGQSGFPSNSLPSAQIVAQGGTKVFSTANGNAMGVSDPDSPSLTVTLTANHGTLKAIGGGGSILADGFPAKIIAGYWPGWDVQPLTSVSQNYNVVYLFAARNAGNNLGDGSVAWDWPGFPTLNDVQAVRARGQKVILSIGGAGHGFLYDTRTKSQNLVNSLISIINAFGGVDGIDFNHYEGGITDESNKVAHAAEMVWIAQQMKAQYGANFAITSPPQPNSTIDQYLLQQLSLANCLTYCTPQYYDWSGFKAVGFISGLSGGTNRNQTWVSLLGPTKVCLGLAANYDPNNSLTLTEANREWDAVVAVYPTERGVSAWNTKLDADGGNAFANNFKAKFGTGGSGAAVTNNESTNVTITGTVGEINAALNGLVYTPAPSYTGPDTITISTTDGAHTKVDTLQVTVGTAPIAYSFVQEFNNNAEPLLRWLGGQFYPYWTYYGGDPQPEGVDGIRGWGGEYEVYTTSGYTTAPYNPFEISNGTLKITAIPKGTTYPDAPQPYLSGALETSNGPFWQDAAQRATRGGFEQKYGTWEIRCKIPKGQGVWCAFWLDGGITYGVTPGDQHGEIDIFEVVGDGLIYQTVHNHWEGGSEDITIPLAHEAAFHNYKVEWTPDNIIWYIDGVETFRASQEMAHKYRDICGPMYLAINQALGGWLGPPDGTTPFPSVFEIDWVRVLPYTGASAPPPPPPPPPPAGANGADVLLGIFGAGNQGAWLDPQPISAFNVWSTGNEPLTAYGDGTPGTALFGRWKDRSGRAHDLLEPDQFSRPSAHNNGGYPHAAIYDRAPITNAGGASSKFYVCVVVESSTYYGTILSDIGGANTGMRLGHDADNAAGNGDLYVSVGTGTGRVTARMNTGAPAFTPMSGKHVIEAWWEGPGHDLTLRLDKSSVATAQLNSMAVGAVDMLLGADTPSGSDWYIADYYQVVVVKDDCPSSSGRDLIATWAGARAGLTV